MILDWDVPKISHALTYSVRDFPQGNCAAILLLSMTLNQLPVPVSADALTAFCKKWKVRSLAVFGSILTKEFTPSSDIDFLVQFEEGQAPDLFDFVQMRFELQDLFHRQVDLVSRKAIERSTNSYRKEEILGTSQIIYEKEAA